ncbi:MAG: disulfide bond formation protein B [Parcubacteria group bacterium]
MVENINIVLPYLVLVFHAVFVVTIAAFIFRHSWGRTIQMFVGKNAMVLAGLISLVAVLGSLFYSEVVGFEPCVLCWWQRVFLYPLVIIFGVALWKKATSAFLYATPLALGAAIIAAYHSYVYMGGASILPCTALGGACSKIYVMAFGYITIPMMSLTIALYILLLAWAHKIYAKNHPHS